MKMQTIRIPSSLKSYSFSSIPSITYLILQGIKIHGLGNISAISFYDKRFHVNIHAKKGCAIGKRVIMRAPVIMDEHVYIDDECYIKGGPVRIGKHTNIMFRSEIVGPVIIGNFCAIARNSIFQSENHLTTQPSLQRKFYRSYFNTQLSSSKKKGIEVGNDVWIGTQAIILPGIKIGDGSIIGAGSIVTKNVEPYSVVAGNPAEFKKWRFTRKIRIQLLELKWWEWSNDRIIRNQDFFRKDLTTIDDITTLLKE